MKRSLLVLSLLLALAPIQAQTASAAAPCSFAFLASLIRVTWFDDDSHAGFFEPKVSSEFRDLTLLPDSFIGGMSAHTDTPTGDYWEFDDPAHTRYYPYHQQFPYLLEYWVGKYDDTPDCQILVGTEDSFSELAFVYVFPGDYWVEHNDADPGEHPELGAYYMPLSEITALLEPPK